MPKSVTFYSEAVKLAGDLLLPADIKRGERRARIVLGESTIYDNNCTPRERSHFLQSQKTIVPGLLRGAQSSLPSEASRFQNDRITVQGGERIHFGTSHANREPSSQPGVPAAV